MASVQGSTFAGLSNRSTHKFRGQAWADADTDDEETQCDSLSTSSGRSSTPPRSPSPSDAGAEPESPRSASAQPPGCFYVPAAPRHGESTASVWPGALYGDASLAMPWSGAACDGPWRGSTSGTAEALPPPPAASVGSVGHPYACGAACKYAAKKGCKDGANCTHCHVCLWSSKLYNLERRQKRKARDAARRGQ